MKYRPSLVVALVAVLLASACITHTSIDPVYQDGNVTINLRGRVKSGEVISRGFEQPAIIAPQRLARVLSAIEVETGDGDDRERTAIMAFSLLSPVSQGLSKALEQAGPGQEVVVMAVRKQRRTVALFHKKFLTSFIAYVKNEELNIHLSRVNWEVPKNQEDDLPIPRLGDQRGDFRTVPIRGMRRLGPQTIAARWRDPIFEARLVRLPSDPSKVRTRTILMESRLPVEELDSDVTPEELENLTQGQRQALEDLQISRENGEITEDEYVRARDDLLGRTP